MLQHLWIIQIILLLCILALILFLCIITDLPVVLGISFSKKETIDKYIEKNILFKKENEKSVCTFKLIASSTFGKISEVYIVMCICKYKRCGKKYEIIEEYYKNGIVKMVRQFGVYRIVDLKMSDRCMFGFFPSYIINTDEYKESVSDKYKKFLKESNYIKANKRLRIKKVFKI